MLKPRAELGSIIFIITVVEKIFTLSQLLFADKIPSSGIGGGGGNANQTLNYATI